MKSPDKTKILITGGHMTPALAVLAKLKGKGYRNFIWVGHKYNQFGTKSPSAEFNTISDMEIRFIDLKAGKLTRNWGTEWWAGLLNLVKIPWGMIHGMWIVLYHRPDLVMSFGGYLALPIVIWGWFFRRKVLTHEQTVVTGLTNRIIPKFVQKILISWPSSAQYYPPKKTVLTGNPLREDIFKVTSTEIQFDNDLPVVYLTGGNQGSYKLNQAVFEKIEEILQITNLLHQTGNNTTTQDWERALSLLVHLPEELRTRYVPKSFFYADVIGEVFAKSDLIISRSGVNTTMEALALGKPSIFVPIPWVTHNEQYLNAKVAADTGLALILSEQDLTSDTLLECIRLALANLKQGVGFNGKPLLECIDAAKKQVIPDAATRIVAEIESLLQ